MLLPKSDSEIPKVRLEDLGDFYPELLPLEVEFMEPNFGDHAHLEFPLCPREALGYELNTTVCLYGDTSDEVSLLNKLHLGHFAHLLLFALLYID